MADSPESALESHLALRVRFPGVPLRGTDRGKSAADRRTRKARAMATRARRGAPGQRRIGYWENPGSGVPTCRTTEPIRTMLPSRFSRPPTGMGSPL